MQQAQIRLTDDQARQLRELATAQGCSVADWVRQGVEKLPNCSAMPTYG